MTFYHHRRRHPLRIPVGRCRAGIDQQTGTVLKQITPPIVRSLGRGLTASFRILKQTFKKEPLHFDVEYSLLIDVGKRANIYGEQGIGKSIMLVLRNTYVFIGAAGTALPWFKKTGSIQGTSDLASFECIDVDPINHWSMPADYSNRHTLSEYISALWTGKNVPTCF